MKKTAYSLVSLFVLWGNFCIVAVAAQPQASPRSSIHLPSFFNQGRVGFGLAGEYISCDANLKLDATSFGRLYYASQSKRRGHLQIAPSLEIGAAVANDYYFGLLLSWRYSGLKTKSRTPLASDYSFFHEFKLNHCTDISIKAGYKVGPRTMVYGLIGPSIASWTHKTDLFDRQTLNDQLKISQTTVGLVLGMGLEYFFKETYAFSIDCTHHFLKSASKQKNMGVVFNVGGLIPRNGPINAQVHPSFSTIAVRFTKFFSL